MSGKYEIIIICLYIIARGQYYKIRNCGSAQSQHMDIRNGGNVKIQEWKKSVYIVIRTPIWKSVTNFWIWNGRIWLRVSCNSIDLYFFEYSCQDNFIINCWYFRMYQKMTNITLGFLKSTYSECFSNTEEAPEKRRSCDQQKVDPPFAFLSVLEWYT